MSELKIISELRGTLAAIAFKTRCADKLFPHLDLEYKNFLNLIGKILGDIIAFWRSYEWAGEGEKRQIFRQMYDMYCFMRTKKEGA